MNITQGIDNLSRVDGRPIVNLILTEEESKRFFSRIEKGAEEKSCWIWVGQKFKNGYGAFYMRKKLLKSHRVSFAIHKGDIPAGICVCHKCDVRDCCNPDHLFLGTNLDNVRDRVEKGRSGSIYGIDHPNAKLTPESVREIRARSAAGETRAVLARVYEVDWSVVDSVIKRETWDHVD